MTVAFAVGVDVALIVAVGVAVAVRVGVAVATGSDSFVTWYFCGSRSLVPLRYSFATRSYAAGESFCMPSVRVAVAVVGWKNADRTVRPVFLHILSSHRYSLRRVPGDG